MIIKLFLDSQLRAFFIFKQNQLNLIFHFFKIYSKSYKEQYKSNALIHFLLLNLFWSTNFNKKNCPNLTLAKILSLSNSIEKVAYRGCPARLTMAKKRIFIEFFNQIVVKYTKKFWPIEKKFGQLNWVFIFHKYLNCHWKI